MTPTKVSGEKKAELIQLRVEKSFADQLNALADRKQLPLSVMLRTWMAEKLRAESKAEQTERSAWIEKRISNLPLQDFVEAPLVVLHAFPLTGNARLTIETLKQHSHALIPGYGHRRYTKSRILQHGLEMVSKADGDDGRLIARGEAFKTGEVETVLSVPCEDKQIFGQQLDYLIVQAVQGLCSIFKAHGIELGYVIRISMLNAKDYCPVRNKVLASSSPLPKFSSPRIDLAEITITSPDQLGGLAQTGEFLIDTLDEICHATGEPGSISFDHNNKWVNEVRG
jgi:hypothetical protein